MGNWKNALIYWVIIPAMIFSSTVNGQKLNSDSLYKVWTNEKASEQERLNAYYMQMHSSKTAFNVGREREYAKWYKDADKALEMAKRFGKTKYLGLFYAVAVTDQLVNENNKEKACEYANLGLELLSEQKDDFSLLNLMPTGAYLGCPAFSDEKIKETLAMIKSRLQDKDSSLFNAVSGMFQFFRLHNVEKACEYFTASLNGAIEEKDYDFAMGILSFPFANCGSFTDDKVNELLLAIENRSESKAEKIKSQKAAYLLLSESYQMKNRFPQSLQAARKVIEYSEKLGEFDERYISAIRNIGFIHNAIGNYKESEKYLLEGLKWSNKTKNINLQGSYYIGLARLYTNLQNEARARTYLDSGIHIMKDVKQCEGCYMLARIVRAGINNLAKKYQEALTELQEVKTDFVGAPLAMGNNGSFYVELSKAYYGLQQYAKAIASAETGLNEVEISISEQSDLYKTLYLSRERTGDFKAALGDYKIYNELQDSITVLRNSEQVTRLELENKFARDKLSSELNFQAELNAQKTNRNIIIGFGIIALLLALGLYFRLQHTRKTRTLLQEKNRIIEAEKDKAKESEKAKQQFLANMSHEIRTPMNAIKGMTDILLRRDPQPEQLSYLNGISESSKSLLVVVNDILDFSKIDAGKIDLETIPFSLEQVIRNVQTISQLRADEKGLELKTDIKTGGTNVIGDPTRLHQVLLNLAGNAIKFTDKGVVTIELKTDETEHGTVNANFCVSDTGIGIGEDRLEKIFESFEQAYTDTTRKFGGTGLGLSISKKLVEIQGGKIWVETDKGKGSRFYFTIPYKYDEKADLSNTDQKIPGQDNIADKLKGIKVLLVEDNNFNAIVAKEELEDAIEDVRVTVAENGAIAVEQVLHGDFDIVLMDVQMPVMSGYEATEKIRASGTGRAGIPIIAMTANVMKEEIEHCREVGMNDFIGKPFDTEKLLHKIFNLTKPPHHA